MRNPDYFTRDSLISTASPRFMRPSRPSASTPSGPTAPAGEFRGLPPSARDELKQELGDKIVVQTSDWNCGNVITPNHKKKPFDETRWE